MRNSGEIFQQLWPDLKSGIKLSFENKNVSDSKTNS
jgi:hypothetical protein